MSSERRAVRITLLLGDSESTRLVLELLTQLTWKGSAEVQGLFIEDSDLLHLAQLPFARGLCRVTHAEGPLEKADIERQLRIQARAAQLAFEAAATRAGINHSFRTLRGALAALLQQAAQEMDLVILGPARRLLPLFAPAPVDPFTRQSRRPVVALYDRSGSAARALATAQRLAAAGERQLTVLLAAENQAGAARLQRRAARQLGGIAARWRPLPGADIDSLLRAVRGEHAVTLVLGVSDPLLQPGILRELSQGLECPALLVR